MATDRDIAHHKLLLAKHSCDQLIAKIHNLVATDAEHIAAVQLLHGKQNKTQMHTLVAAWLAVLAAVVGILVQIYTSSTPLALIKSLTPTASSAPPSSAEPQVANPPLAPQPPAPQKP